MIISVTYGDFEWSLEGITAGEWYRWQVEVMALGRSGEHVLAAERALLWLSDVMAIDATEIAEGVLEAPAGPFGLGRLIIEACAPPLLSDVDRWQAITYGSDAYEPDAIEDEYLPCQCFACRGKADRDDTCKYFALNPFAGVISNIDMELLSQCWSLPLSVYMLRKTTARAVRLGREAAKQRQRAKAIEDERKKGANQEAWGMAELPPAPRDRN